MSSGVYIVLGAVFLAVVAGATLALLNGRFRGTHAVRGASAATAAASCVGARRVSVGGAAGRARHAPAVLLSVLRALPRDPADPG